MELKEVLNIADKCASDIIRQYRDPKSIEEGIAHSIGEERAAITAYRKRAKHALDAGNKPIARLYSRIADDEGEHEFELKEALIPYADAVQGEKNIREFYDALKKSGIEVPSDFEEFKKLLRMGFWETLQKGSPPAERKKDEFTVKMDRQGNILITHSNRKGDVFLQFESDKDSVLDMLRKEERDDVENGWPITIGGTESRASIFQELWEVQNPPAERRRDEKGYMSHNPPMKIVYDGKTWGVHMSFPTRKEAEDEARDMRQSGKKVKVLTWEYGYAVYELIET